jgi:Tol biopolymer transport system component
MRGARWAIVAVACLAMACTKHNPRACANGLCTDPAYPFCDVDGSFSGTPDTCIAVNCTPMEFKACRGNDSITCNATGDNYDITQCESTCDPSMGCIMPRVLYIAFSSDRDGNSEIYRMNPDGSMPTNLTSNSAKDTNPIWDPTGEHIAFLSDRGGVQELYVMKPDGSGVTNVSAGQAQEPTWAPDGTQLVFTSTRSSNPEIYKAPASGGSPKQLTMLGVNSTGHAAWSPDGTKIAFESALAINVMNSDGTGVTQLPTTTVLGDHEPTWSPDGSKLAFSRKLTFPNWDIIVANPDGSAAVDVTSTSSTSTIERVAFWSSDGVELVGEIEEGNTGDPHFGDAIYAVDATGANFHYIAVPPAQEPCWSGDGMSIFYESTSTGNNDIYRASRSGGSSTDLTNSQGSDTQCSVRPK